MQCKGVYHHVYYFHFNEHCYIDFTNYNNDFYGI